MKKIIALGLLLCLFLTPKAQVQTMTSSSYTIGAGVTQTLLSGKIGRNYNAVAIAVTGIASITPLSGTATLSGSLDGSHYSTVPSVSTFTLAAGTPPSTYIWRIPVNYYQYYAITTVNSATIACTGTMSGYVLPRTQ